MKKYRNIPPISVVARGNSLQNIDLNEIVSSETEIGVSFETIEKPLTDLLAISSEFFIFSYSPALKSLITWSDNAEVVLGVEDRRIARDGNIFLRHVHQDDRFHLLNKLEDALAGRASFRATYRWIRPDRNQQRWLHCRATLKKTGSAELLEGIILDISDEIQAPLEYFAAAESLNTVLSALPGLVIIVADKDLRIISLSISDETHDFKFGDPAFKKNLFQIGRDLISCFSDEELISRIKSTASQILSGKQKNLNFRIVENERSYRVDFYSRDSDESSNGLVCVVSEITELVRLEGRVSKLQKVESLRALSAGVGHHLNNALQTIIGQSTIINSHADNVDLVRQTSDSIVSSSLKASELTRKLFTNLEKDINQFLDPNLVLTDALNKVDHLLDSGFEVKIVLGQLPLVKSNYNDLSAVFESILTRARNALGGNKVAQNCLSIETSQQIISNSISSFKMTRYAVVSIRNLCSSRQSREQHCLSAILAPNAKVSVQMDSSASILNLSQCFSIINSIGGQIVAAENQSGNDSIEIYLPSDAAAEDQRPNFQPRHGCNQLSAPRLLLIDDNLPLGSSMQAMFEELNESCILAVNYEQASTLLLDYLSSIELVLLDAVLPGSDPVMIIERLKHLKPSLKILGFSGANSSLTEPLMNFGALEILEKPIDAPTLKSVLARYLKPLNNENT